MNAEPSEKRVPKKRRPFPWLALLLLLASIYFLWIFPLQQTASPVKIEYLPEGSSAQNVAPPGTN